MCVWCLCGRISVFKLCSRYFHILFFCSSARIRALAREAGAELTLDVGGRDLSEVEESARLSRARSVFFSVERRCGRADYLNHNNRHTSNNNTPAKITIIIQKKKRTLLIIFYIISFVDKTAVWLILSHSWFAFLAYRLRGLSS